MRPDADRSRRQPDHDLGGRDSGRRSHATAPVRAAFTKAWSILRYAAVIAILGHLAAGAAEARTFVLEWDQNPEPDVAGYLLSWGTSSGNYTTTVDVENETTYTFTEPDPTRAYYFAVRAYNAEGALSEFSDEVVSTPTVVPIPVLSALSLNTSSISGGQTAQGTVTLSSAAQSGGVVVTISSSAPSTASVPASVTVPSGSTTATFTVSTSTVTSNTPATITAAAGSVTKTASLTVSASGPTNVAPVITAQPANATVAAAQNATFTTSATGTPAPTYQWQRSTNGGSSWSNVSNNSTYSGATTTSLRVTATASLNGNRFRAVATNSVSSATSQSATLTVTSSTVAPSITTQPANVSTSAGQSPSFTVAANGTPAPSYSWQVSTNNGGSWSTVSNSSLYSGATTATLRVLSVPQSLSGARYRALAANSAGSATSQTATLTVSASTVTIVAVTLSDNTPMGGESVQGTVTLSSPAPSGGTVVTLSSSMPSAAPVPGNVIVPAGLTILIVSATTRFAPSASMPPPVVVGSAAVRKKPVAASLSICSGVRLFQGRGVSSSPASCSTIN